jgi:hypothetical protein
MFVACQTLGLDQVLEGDVDAGDAAARADLDRSGEDVHVGAAAEIEHAFAREQAGETEVVANARERPDGLGGSRSSSWAGVAERLLERPAGREVKVALHLVRHVAVHLRGVPIELVGIDAYVGWVCCCVCMAGASPAALPKPSRADGRAPNPGSSGCTRARY